jgi:hypothetical protein
MRGFPAYCALGTEANARSRAGLVALVDGHTILMRDRDGRIAPLPDWLAAIAEDAQAPVRQLASEFGIHRTTVMAHLRRNSPHPRGAMS